MYSVLGRRMVRRVTQEAARHADVAITMMNGYVGEYRSTLEREGIFHPFGVVGQYGAMLLGLVLVVYDI
jgi:hypothetical protein